MKKKMDIDVEIAAELGVARRKVSNVTAAFLDAIRKHLTNDEVVHLEGFGKLRVQRTTGVRQPLSSQLWPSLSKPIPVPVKHKVHFSKARPFKRQLQERWERDNQMEKYAVDENVNQKGLEKAAAEGCPKCGSKLDKHGSVLICPTHGSEPFEQGNDGSQKNK